MSMDEETKPLKSWSYSDKSQMKVGDRVFIDIDPEKHKNWEGDGCPLCYEPTDEEAARGEFTFYEEEQLCKKHYEEINKHN